MARVSIKKAAEFSGGDYAFGFLKLEDGDSVTVRLPYADVEDIEVYMGHTLSKKHNFKNVECLREEGDPKSVCPFCEEGKNDMFSGASPKAYFLFVEDGKEEEGFKVWVKGGDIITDILSIIDEYDGQYDELSNIKFKIKRKGTSTNTKYSIMLPAKNAIDDTSVDDLLEMTGKDKVPNVRESGNQILIKTAEEMEYFIDNGEWESTSSLGAKEEKDDEEPIRRRGRKISAKSKRSDEEDEDEDEEETPKRRSRRDKSDDEEEDERPTRKSRKSKPVEEDDEEDERPQRKSRRSTEEVDEDEDEVDEDVSARRSRRKSRRASDRI